MQGSGARLVVATFLSLTLLLSLSHSVLDGYFRADVVDVPPTPAPVGPALSQRVVLIVIDGLRSDSALTWGAMPKLEALAHRGASGIAFTGAITMTFIGVRALGTGTQPGLADLLRYGEQPPITFDNPLRRVRERGGHVALVGDTPFLDAFKPYIDIDLTAVDPAARARHYFDNVYGDDADWTLKAVGLMGRTDWQLGIVMLGGVDHASHRFTPMTAEFRKKLASTDEDIARIVAAAGAGTTVIITSDHGTGERGHHGSGEPEARETPLIFAGPGIVPGARLGDAAQIDVAPTIAALLGLPLPAPSEGRVLVEALAVPGDERARLLSENRSQHQRYAMAWATKRGVQPPAIGATAEGLRAMSAWLEATRSRGRLVPPIWAAALLWLAFAVVLRRSWLAPGDRSPILNPREIGGALVAVAASITNLAGDGARPWPAIAALVGATCAVWPRAEERRSWGPIAIVPLGAAFVGVAALETSLGLWRLHYRTAQLAFGRAIEALHLREEEAVLLALALVAVAAATRLRRTSATEPSRLIALLCLIFAGAAGDALAIPAAIVVAGLTAVVLGGFDDALALTAALLAGGASLIIGDWPQVTSLPLAYLGPPCLLLLALGDGEAPRRPLSFLALLAVLWRLPGVPPTVFHAALTISIAGLAIASYLRRAAGGTALLGWGAAIVIAGLSRGPLMPGLIAFVWFAARAGRLEGLRVPGLRSRLAAAFLVTGARVGLFALFEGAFRFSRIEVDVAYLGNPGTEHLTGGAIVALKFLLAFVAPAALVTARQGPMERIGTVALCAVLWALRVVHIVGWITLARDTFHAPYVDAGHLFFSLLLAASAVATLLVVAGLSPPSTIAPAEAPAVTRDAA